MLTGHGWRLGPAVGWDSPPTHRGGRAPARAGLPCKALPECSPNTGAAGAARKVELSLATDRRLAQVHG